MADNFNPITLILIREFGDLPQEIITDKDAVAYMKNTCPFVFRAYEAVTEEIMQTVSQWQPIGTQPDDQWVLLATTSGWVGEAVYGEDEENPQWRWKSDKPGLYVHENHKPLGWQSLPKSPESEAA